MSTRSLSAMAFALAILGPVACDRARGEPAERAPKRHTVIMEGMAFRPAVITVAPGDLVVWVNKDMVPHSATTIGGGFDSGVVRAGTSWSSRAQQPGDVEYVCSFHPTMKATIRIR